MSLSSEMEKNSTEDDCVDSGAETGGSDYSPMSSTCSELSLVELQDPFLVSVHIITDPGQATPLQRAADTLLSCIHPELLLFRVSERGTWQQRHKRARAYPSSLQRAPPPQPALALILFLQEGEGEYGGEEQLSRLHRALQRPPWQYHHTERVNGRLLPLAPCSQDFFTLAPGTPLWAVRQVHYGKEIVRFTVYCRHQTFSDMVAMYRLLLRRPLAQRREDFCFFVVYSNPDTEIQLSFKRLPRGQNPAPTEAAILEFRVRDVGGMVPLLPHPCTPISEARWQTEDYDGNKILLQVRGPSRYRRRHTVAQFTQLPPDSSPTPSPPPWDPTPSPGHTLSHRRDPASYRSRRHPRTLPRPRSYTFLTRVSNQDLHQEEEEEEEEERPYRDPEVSRAGWVGHRTRSLFSLPTTGLASQTSPTPSPAHSRCSSLARPFRLKVEALVGAEETDVDSGRKVDSGGIDLSVVSAYSWPRPRAHPLPRPLSAPPRDPFMGEHGPLWSSGSASTTPSVLRRPRPQSACLPLATWEDEVRDEGCRDTPTEEEQEFYI
ncbi:hypothetical protein AGOR_G00059080 [Albula goreensis]|uniref:FAM124 domain-containing protein n=1 Tax=Albula goreensis TaxID=1534307 RepID=A0A8T3DUV6_9TELE|nr:hypothetical protein AGOR_G00059080 [Albula goreensis]